MPSQAVIVAAEKWLTYNADVRHMTNVDGTGVGELVGPDPNKEFWEAVEADYDSTTGKTRVGFASALLTQRARKIRNEQKEITNV